jgi:hypothetical protein
MFHLKRHTTDNLAVCCPFKKCSKTFTLKSSFTSHISRHHDLCDKVTIPVAVQQEFESVNCLVNDEVTNDDTDVEVDEGGTFCAGTDLSQLLRSLAMFCLKLQAKFLLPASTIQSIVDEMETFQTLGFSVALQGLYEKLVSMNIPDPIAKDIVRDITKNNPFKTCAAGELCTHQTRQTFYKKFFKFVGAKEVYLGTDVRRIARFAQYVSIK